MRALSTAIYSKVAGSPFYTAIGGRFYKNRVPQDMAWPYAIYFIITNSPENTFTDHIENVIVQFSLFSSTSSSSEIEDLYTLLKNIFDDTTFTITGNKLIVLERQSASLESIPADTEEGTGEYWQYDIDFNITMQRVSI